MVRALIAGWFSFEQMGATAGDLLARDAVCRWLDEAGIPWDVALVPPFTGGVDWRKVAPAAYSLVVFVCGPFGNGEPVTHFLERFAGCRLIGVDLTMLQPLEEWNPFDVLLERDSSAASRPDFAFLAPPSQVPVVGVVLIHPQPEYEDRDHHAIANAAIQRLIARTELAGVTIDTRLDINSTGLRTAGEVDALIGRMDIILTTRLHGLVLAIKNGVPAVVIDPVAGGAKLRRQADTIGWPLVFTTDDLSDEVLSRAFAFCRTQDAKTAAQRCRERAIALLQEARREFHCAVAHPSRTEN